MSVKRCAIVAVCALLFVPACGDDDNGGSDTSTDTGMDTSNPPRDTSDPDPDSTAPDPDTGDTNSGRDTMDAGDTGPRDTGDDTGMDTGMDTGTDTGDRDISTADTMDAGGSGMSVRSLRSTSAVSSLNPGDSTSSEFTVTDVIVTGIDGDGSDTGFFVQDNSMPRRNSGLWIFTGNNQLSGSLPTINEGTVLEITGTVTNFARQSNPQEGLLEIEQVSNIRVISQGASLPTPVQVAASDVATGGADQEAFEGVLIEVQNVQAAGGPNQFDDTELNSGLFIGPALYQYTNDFSPSQGTTYSSVVGPLNFSFGNAEISPRSMADITP